MRRSGAERVLVEGTGEGEVVVLHEPLSFWGGLEAATGRIVDRRHPQHGVSIARAVVVMPAGRGSSSSSSVLAEAVRRGTAPVVILLARPDQIVALGAIVAKELYGTAPPVVVLDEHRFRDAARWRRARVEASSRGLVLHATN